MTVPSLPFNASQALSEFEVGLPGTGTQLASAVGISKPYNMSSLAGRSYLRISGQNLVSDQSATGSQTLTAIMTVTGGAAPLSYSWSPTSQTGSDGIPISCSNPTTLNASFVSHATAANTDNEGDFTCTVTDAHGATASCTINVQYIWTGAPE
jgi:hypothetical protein